MFHLLAGLLTLPGMLAPAADPVDDDPPELVYQLSGRPDAGLKDSHVPGWNEGTVLYAAVDGVALRESPSPSARRLGTLPIGTAVRVVRGDAPLQVQAGFVHRWVSVEVDGAAERGYVFGAFLTPLIVTADLDGDGQSEVATAAFTQDAQALVRIASARRATQSISFRVAGEGYLSVRGGAVSMRLVPAAESGIALLRVYTGQHACANYSTQFVSFVAAQGGAVPRPRIALETSGLADPPNFALVTEEFDAAARTVTVRTAITYEDADGKEVKKPDKVETYRLEDGVYR
jgi:hypothetical protein